MVNLWSSKSLRPSRKPNCCARCCGVRVSNARADRRTCEQGRPMACQAAPMSSSSCRQTFTLATSCGNVAARASSEVVGGPEWQHHQCCCVATTVAPSAGLIPLRLKRARPSDLNLRPSVAGRFRRVSVNSARLTSHGTDAPGLPGLLAPAPARFSSCAWLWSGALGEDRELAVALKQLPR
jgi:hypothetical protein